MKFKALCREPGGEGVSAAFGIGERVCEADDLMKLDAGEIRDGAEGGVANDVKIGEAGEAEGFRQASAAGGLLVVEDVRGVAGVGVEFVAEEERAEEGGLVLAAAEEAVDAFIGRVEWAVGLEDDVGLTLDEVAGGL